MALTISLGKSLMLSLVLLSGCVDKKYQADPAGGHGFRCWPSDQPACPNGFLCCADGLCGDFLRDDNGYQLEGWCIPAEAAHPAIELQPAKFWDFGAKLEVSTATQDPLLVGIDSASKQWRCPRSEPAKHEPNDGPKDAILAGTLIPDNVIFDWPSYEICPDQAAPTVPDIDVIRFKLSDQAKVIIELKYNVGYGDLDVALFQLPDGTSNEPPVLLQSDLSANDDACIEKDGLASGTYYVVVRGAPTKSGRYVDAAQYAMNRYKLRITAVRKSLGLTCRAIPDGGSP